VYDKYILNSNGVVDSKIVTIVLSVSRVYNDPGLKAVAQKLIIQILKCSDSITQHEFDLCMENLQLLPGIVPCIIHLYEVQIEEFIIILEKGKSQSHTHVQHLIQIEAIISIIYAAIHRKDL
jgi:hypothetical protein